MVLRRKRVAPRLVASSWDGRLVAYNRSENNSDEATMHLSSTSTTGRSPDRRDPGHEVRHRASWTPAGDGFYYVRLPVDPSPDRRAPRIRRVRFHSSAPTRRRTSPAREDGRPDQVPRRLGVEGRALALLGDRARVELERSVLPRPRRTQRTRAEWTVARGGKDAQYSRHRVPRMLLRRDERRAPKWRVFP